MKKYQKALTVATTVAFLGLYGCAATHTTLSKGRLDVQTRMSDTIFLTPVAQSQKTVFVEVKNTSGNNHLNLEGQVKSKLSQKGYTIVSNPNKAHYLLQANVLKVGKFNLTQANSLLDSGFGGGIMGAATAGALGGNTRTALGVGLAGAVVGMAADALVKDNLYTIVTDIQISEKTSAKVKETTKSHLHQGTSTKKIGTSTVTTDYNRYQTRIISSANKVNLKLEEALPELVNGLSNSIAGIM